MEIPENGKDLEQGVEYELPADFDPRKSFGGKARVKFMFEPPELPRVVLVSYETEIAEAVVGGHVRKYEEEGLSGTTRRHLREFEKQARRLANLLEEKLDTLPFGLFA